ncbi:MAG: FAD-binding protein, partial [Lysobacter sp.]
DFDCDDDGALRLGREGGHQCARIVHAGGDATGARVVAALSRAVAAASHVRWRGGIDVDGLLLRGGRIAGVRLGSAGAGEVVETDAVVLATGGIGALFARTTNPAGADGSGLALALAAGARSRDLEFVQFHPTALDLPSHSLPLLTEALRGRGARLVDADGRLLMAGLHPQADLAPRDVVSRRVWQAGCNGGAWLDSTGLGIDWCREFPTALAACTTHGIDPAAAPVPVTAAAHFHMGGLAVDATGSTTLPGLYAVGEVACNGVHGANRLASNSLLEGVVFGRRLGVRLARSAFASRPSGAAVLVERGRGLSNADLGTVRDLLWRAAGPVRSGSGLQSTLTAVTPFAQAGWQGRLAGVLIEAAARRRVNIGAHWCEDRATAALLEPGAA